MWHIQLYQSQAGHYPVADYLEGLDARSRAKVARVIDLLEEFGIQLGMPYAKHLEDKVWELRSRQGRLRHRILYFLNTGNTFVLLHGLTKKTDAVSRSDIRLAKERAQDYLRGRAGR